MEDDYPYYNFTETDIKKMFENLKNSKMETDHRKYIIKHMPQLKYYELLYLPDMKQTYLITEENSYEKYDTISSYFTEKYRVRAKRKDREFSNWDYWNKNKELIKNEAKKQDISVKDMIYNMYYEVTAFRSSILVYFIRKFNVKSVLDFCAGWGDRLLACLAMDVNYTGVDTNTDLFPHYHDMVKMFGTTKKITLINSEFQKANIEGEYDLVFTSPPYYDLENYGIDITETPEQWYENFLIFSIRKAWKHLLNNGHMIIIINDIPEVKYVEKMIQDVNKFEDSIYYGVISYSKNQPMWIWKKQKLQEPELVISNYSNFYVVRDDILPAGTYQRFMKLFNKKENELVCSNYGLIQVAISIAGKIYNKNVTIFTNYLHIFTLRARMYGAKIIITKEPFQEATKYIKPGMYLYNPKSIDLKSIDLKSSFDFNYKTIWLTLDNNIIINAIKGLGKNIKLKFVKNTDLTESVDMKLMDFSNNYDNKIWYQYMKYGEPNDIIWNSGSDLNIFPTSYNSYTEEISKNEYYRYKTTNMIINFDPKIKEKFKHILIELSNIKNKIDQVYGINDELFKSLGSKDANMVKYNINNYLKIIDVLTPLDFKINVFINGNNVNINYGNYNLFMDLERFNLMMEKSKNIKYIINAALRYESIKANITKISEAKNADIEGITNPFISNFMLINKPYCSLFPDTDGVFGSIGNFLDTDFQNKTVYVNKYYEFLLKKIESECLKAEKENNSVRFIIPDSEISSKYMISKNEIGVNSIK